MEQESLDSVARRVLEEVEVLTGVLRPVMLSRIEETGDPDLVLSALLTMYGIEIERMQQPSC